MRLIVARRRRALRSALRPAAESPRLVMLRTQGSVLPRDDILARLAPPRAAKAWAKHAAQTGREELTGAVFHREPVGVEVLVARLGGVSGRVLRRKPERRRAWPGGALNS